MVKVGVICTNEYSKTVQDYLLQNFQDITEIKKRKFNNDGNTTKISCLISVPEKMHISEIYKDFQQLDQVESVSVEDFGEA